MLKSKADLAFIMHSLVWLATNGTAAIVCFPGVMYRGGAEKEDKAISYRKQLYRLYYPASRQLVFRNFDSYLYNGVEKVEIKKLHFIYRCV